MQVQYRTDLIDGFLAHTGLTPRTRINPAFQDP
jgi:hypothetical protein